ncbi:hypothetical protein BP00DRAFT_450020 [Aspergillus indologenus CBS 114.80]|uniref:Uncharacterized protein n=1 Tax=Aspergillus indologenus CBS 114.80 TaxID=1450541 RepID=A0A2V5HT74_9EURO|nr:hypothetical protein BP00DRAFT_450020 [Aspergillus indologenus CBS 114.80]
MCTDAGLELQAKNTGLLKVSEKDDRDTVGGSLPASSRSPFAVPSAARAWIPSPLILPSSTDIKSTGYDTVAFEPYRTLRQLRGQDIVPHRVLRFQGLLPLLLNRAIGHSSTRAPYGAGAPPRAVRMVKAIQSIVQQISRRRSRAAVGILLRDRRRRIYICYREDQHVHFVEPEDFGLVVELAKQVVQRGFTRASSTGCI